MMTLGFLGLGIMGKEMALNLLKAGFDVTVWNRTPDKCTELVNAGAKQGQTPKMVAASCDITIAMVADPVAARALAFGPDGVVAGIGEGRGYIDMSTVDATTSQAIDAAIIGAGGRFLEAPVSGTKQPARDGTLVILAGGDKSLYQDAAPVFAVLGKMSPYLGATGQGANMKLVVNMIMGGMLATFAEGMALGQKSGLEGQAILDVIAGGALTNPMFSGKGSMWLKKDYSTSFPLKHMQKDLRLALALGDKLEQPLPQAASANEVFKQARKAGLSDEDIAAVYKVVQ